MNKQRYTTHIVTLLGCTLALMLFYYLLVNHHRAIPNKLPQYRLGLLSDGKNTTDRIEPIGRVVYAGAPAVIAAGAAPAATPVTAPAGAVAVARDGPAVYKAACMVCHDAGIAGSPKLDDKEQWAKRIAKGQDTLYSSALNGLQSSTGVMPAKGGNPALSDAEVKSAVDFMVAQSK